MHSGQTEQPPPAHWVNATSLPALVMDAADGVSIVLCNGTFAWTTRLKCSGKAISVTGHSRDGTILDAQNLMTHHFTLHAGCNLTLSSLSLVNSKAGAVNVRSGSRIIATDVAFRDNKQDPSTYSVSVAMSLLCAMQTTPVLTFVAPNSTLIMVARSGTLPAHAVWRSNYAASQLGSRGLYPQ